MATTVLSARTSSIGTTPTAIGNFSAPSASTGTAISGLSIANTNASLSITVNVALWDGTTAIYIVKNCVILPGSAVNLADEGNRIAMNTNDQVLVTSSVAASADAIMSIVEINN